MIALFNVIGVLILTSFSCNLFQVSGKMMLNLEVVLGSIKSISHIHQFIIFKEMQSYVGNCVHINYQCKNIVPGRFSNNYQIKQLTA